MGRLLCMLGRHAWEHHTNPEVGGSVAAYDVCSRCHKERDSYDPAPPQTRGGLA